MMIITEIVKSIASRETFLDKLQLLLILGLIITILIPFPYLVQTSSSNLLGYNSDFTGIWIFPSLLFAILLLLAETFKSLKNSQRFQTIYIYWLIYSIFWIFYHVGVNSDESRLIAYAALKIICALTVGYYVYKSELWLKYKDYLLWVIIVLGSLNSILAAIQFLAGASIGFNLFGESSLSVGGINIAKVVAHGTEYLRGYGLMPHPNILSGLLVIITSLNLYLLTKNTQQRSEIVLYLALFLNISGVFFSFSRAGLAALVIILLTWSVYFVRIRAKFLYPALFAIISWCLVLTFVLLPWLGSRATLSDPAISERALLNTMTFEVVNDHWVFGTGPGTNIIMLHEKLSGKVEDWAIQPVHNYWLINLSDLGLIGEIVLILIVGVALMAIIRFLYNHPTIWLTSLVAIMLAILFLFWFDHYFYTYWPMQLFLWIIIGLVCKEACGHISFFKLFHGKQ